MKRSEMIENIASELIRPEVNFPNWEIANDVAEIILDRIEKEGMSPPEHLYTSGERKDHYLQEWENETK